MKRTRLSLVHMAKLTFAAAAITLAVGALDGTVAQGSDVRRFEGRELTFAGYSSTFNEEWDKAFGQFFEKRTGIKITISSGRTFCHCRWLELFGAF